MPLTKLPPLDLRGTRPGGATTSAPAISDAIRRTFAEAQKTQQALKYLTEEMASGRLPAGAMPKVARAVNNMAKEGDVHRENAAANMALQAMPGLGERSAHALVPTLGTAVQAWLMTDPDEDGEEKSEEIPQEKMLRDFLMTQGAVSPSPSSPRLSPAQMYDLERREMLQAQKHPALLQAQKQGQAHLSPEQVRAREMGGETDLPKAGFWREMAKAHKQRQMVQAHKQRQERPGMSPFQFGDLGPEAIPTPDEFAQAEALRGSLRPGEAPRGSLRASGETPLESREGRNKRLGQSYADMVYAPQEIPADDSGRVYDGMAMLKQLENATEEERMAAGRKMVEAIMRQYGSSGQGAM